MFRRTAIVLIFLQLLSCAYYLEKNAPYQTPTTKVKTVIRNELLANVVGIDKLLCDFLSYGKYPRRLELASYNYLSYDTRKKLHKCLRAKNVSAGTTAEYLFVVHPRVDTSESIIKEHMKSVSLKISQTVTEYGENTFLQMNFTAGKFTGSSRGFTTYTLIKKDGKYYISAEGDADEYL